MHICLLKRVIFLFSSIIIFIPQVYADTLYLKNGEKIEGFIKSEGKDYFLFALSYGTVKFTRNEVERIEKSTPEQSARIYKKWEQERKDAEWMAGQAAGVRGRLTEAWNKEKAQAEEEERLSKATLGQGISVSKDQGQIIVPVVLNGSTPASLVLDTGAAMVLLTREIAEKSGLDLVQQPNDAQMKLADGRELKVKYALIKSIKIEDAEAENVEAAVFMDDVSDPGIKDGLLGMSFLKRFNFTVDHEKGKLILKKLEDKPLGAGNQNEDKKY
jgi:clan AA aspartic protease (TIGR02281 family)